MIAVVVPELVLVTIAVTFSLELSLVLALVALPLGRSRVATSESAGIFAVIMSCFLGGPQNGLSPAPATHLHSLELSLQKQSLQFSRRFWLVGRRTSHASLVLEESVLGPLSLAPQRLLLKRRLADIPALASSGFSRGLPPRVNLREPSAVFRE
jgi:hypothetical protein